MSIENHEYSRAKERFAAFGVDVEQAMRTLSNKPISIHCWQGDDVTGFEAGAGVLTGGIQVTGNYPGRARNFDELCADFLAAAKLIPGKKKINLHASYAVFTPENGGFVDRDQLKPKHFEKWVAFARENGFGIDFNPTFFSHPKSNGLTLSSPDKEIRAFWVRHAIACREIAAYFARELGEECLCNLWIPDGFKDIPADRLTPRLLLKQSLDEIYAKPLDGVIDSVESKFFGIGLESCTVGSSEFYISYAASHPGVYPLLDNGHYHPNEFVSDKIPALLPFFDRIALHVTRGVNWDSDHVVRFDDETRELACELVRTGALEKVMIGLDYFDASINRIAAWVIGVRSLQKALLYALTLPHAMLADLQKNGAFTKLLVLQEELKTLPFGKIWEEYCQREGVPADNGWFDAVAAYEKEVLAERGSGR